ncbi:MAG: hypothetical protein JKY40_10410 [Gammaproteobacteria bacterium]|nr:hypothetical protein [Gammaproteobacteria bacterium]MBL4729697.1 hypothetical protein [Gammaproteobacteria bacterium]
MFRILKLAIHFGVVTSALVIFSGANAQSVFRSNGVEIETITSEASVGLHEDLLVTPVNANISDGFSDSTQLFLLRNMRKLREGEGLDTRTFEVNENEKQDFEDLIRSTYAKYTEPDIGFKNAMCDFYTNSENASIDDSERAALAFTQLESQDAMSARWGIIDQNFLVDVRSSFGNNILQNVLEEKDSIETGGRSSILSTRAFVESTGVDLMEFVEFNCKENLK